MGILLAFAPFAAFAVIDRLVGGTAGLIAGALVSAALLARDLVIRRRRPKILEIGTLALFSGLAAYAVITHPAWLVFGVRLWVDAGLLAIVIATMVLRRPFTLQYARETVAPDVWNTPKFLRVNYVITAAWALAFAVMAATDVFMVYTPGAPKSVGIVVTVLALIGAIRFTSWYPERQDENRAPS